MSSKSNSLIASSFETSSISTVPLRSSSIELWKEPKLVEGLMTTLTPSKRDWILLKTRPNPLSSPSNEKTTVSKLTPPKEEKKFMRKLKPNSMKSMSGLPPQLKSSLSLEDQALEKERTLLFTKAMRYSGLKVQIYPPFDRRSASG